MFRNRLLSLLLLIGALGCDNVGRAFDPNPTSEQPGMETGTSIIQVVPIGGDVRNGRPVVRATYPEGAGWPGTVPIVVEFNESVNQASIVPTTQTGTDGRIGVRVQGTTNLLPCQYDLLANGRLLVMRPVTALPNNGNPVYEVVLLSDARDVDGVRFQVTGGERVLGDFQVNQDASLTDGRILCLYPRDNFTEQAREGDVFVVFDRPANTATLTDTNLRLTQQGGAAVPTGIEAAVTTVGIADPRVVRINPVNQLAGGTRYELTVTADITFGQSGNLNFNGRTPFARFTTVAPGAPTLVELGNALPGFPHRINIGNVQNVVLQVTTPDDTLAGDRVRARIYGGDSTTTAIFDLAFVEREVDVLQSGPQTVMLDFATLLGSAASPRFDDGNLTFAAQMLRGAGSSGFIQNATDAQPIFDITPPTLLQAGPPGQLRGAEFDIFTDQEYLAFYGIASEALAAATLTASGSMAVSLFASGTNGRFLMLPLPLARLTGPRSYMLTFTDRSGNMGSPVIGNIVQHGQVTGTLAGTLTVEAYDEATLLPIPGATVLVDIGAPVVPAVSLPPGTTDANGRASFAVAGPSHTVTIVRAGYDLITLYETQAAFVSLPLRPRVNSTATLAGTAQFVPAPNTTVIVGNTAVADGSVLGIRTTNSSPNTIPATPILPNRPQVTTAFGGSFTAAATPTYTLQGCQMLGPTLLVPSVPTPPAVPGAEVAPTVVLVDAGTTLIPLLGPHHENFALAVGLDTANLVTGQPRVRVTSSLQGFTGQALVGIGTVVGSTGADYMVDANYAPPIIGGLSGFAPLPWLVSEAQDQAGRLSRVRVLLNPVSGQITAGTGATAIPVVTAPAGPSIGAPMVTYQDVLNANLISVLIGFHEVTATDAAGRRWQLLVPDRDAAGAADSVQFPDLATPNVVGLQSGSWNVQVEARLLLSFNAETVDDLVLTERVRQEANLARSEAVMFTVQ